MDHHEEASQEPVISRSRVNIMSRPSQQQASGASRPHVEARLPGTSHRARRRGSKRELDSVGSNGRCKKSCTSDRTSEVPVLPPGSSHPPAVVSDLAAEGSSSESGIGSASASSAIQDHSYSLVNELRTLESTNSDLRVTEHSYSLASIGALEAPSTQQFPPTLRRSSRRSARLLTTASRRARARSREESAEPISITSPSRRSNRLLSMTRSGGRPFSMEDEPASSLFVSNQGREYSRLATGGRRASRTQSREESPEVISIADPIRELSQPQEMPVATEDNQDVVETEPPSEMETMRTDPVHHPTEPPALIAVADGTDHLTESFLTSSLDFIRSRSREREARQGRMRTFSHRRSARVANTRRMHTTRRQSAPDVAPPPLPHVLPLPHTTAVRHPLMYTHIPMNLQLFRQPQTDSIHRAMSVLLPSLPSLEPLSSQPTSSVLSRTTGNTEEASGSIETQSDSGLGQESTQGSDEIQMWSEDSVEVPLHSRHYQHLHRSSRNLPHLHRRARRNAQPSILNDISEADLRSLHSRIPQDVDSDVISGDSPGLDQLRRQRTTSAAAAAPASTGGASAPIDVVVVDSDSEEDTDQDVIIINDERPPTESSNYPRSHAATGGDSSPPRLSPFSFLESFITRRRERRPRGFFEVELNRVLHGRDPDRRNGRDAETRGRTLLISATPSVVPRVAEEEEIDSDMVLEVPHQDWQNILIPRSEQHHFPRRPSLFPPPPVMWYPTLESRFHTFEELLDLADDLGPARSHGLTQDEINQLDVRCFGDWDSDSSIDSKCVVCLSEYKCPEKVRTLSCGHLFHQPCIDQWLLGHRTCPICRIDVRSA